MKAKATITEGTPDRLVETFGSRSLSRKFKLEIVQGIFGVEDVLKRPAEFFLQKPDFMPADEDDNLGDLWGLVFTVSGISRGSRPIKMFHDAMERLEELVREAIYCNLKNGGPGVQMWVTMVLDGAIEFPAGSGNYTPILESVPTWVYG